MGGAEFQSIVGRFACQVHWGDCDPAGMIFYPTYFRWVDAASWALFETAAYSPQWMKREHIAMPLVSAQCEFLAPAVHGDRCEVRSRIGRFGGKSFTVEHVAPAWTLIPGTASSMAAGAPAAAPASSRGVNHWLCHWPRPRSCSPSGSPGSVAARRGARGAGSRASIESGRFRLCGMLEE